MDSFQGEIMKFLLKEIDYNIWMVFIYINMWSSEDTASPHIYNNSPPPETFDLFYLFSFC